MQQLRDFDSARQEEEKRRLGPVMLIVAAALGLLLVRLWWMQVVQGSHFRQLSESNRVRIRDISPCRGLVYDRNGVLLVDNRPSFDLCLIPEETGDPTPVLRQLAALSGFPLQDLQNRVAAAKGQPSFRPVVLVSDAGRDLMALVEQHRFELPGVSIEVRPKRNYPYPELAPHLLGYLGEANQEDLDGDERLLPGDYVGKYGLEMASQNVLAGLHGCRRLEVDACGREMRSLGEIKPTYGRSVRLTIDCDLQNVAQQALAGKAGAVLAMDVKTGEILALASAPTFDPNSFVSGLKPEVWNALCQDPRHPLHNRAVQGAFPPGSTYKIVLALAGLEEGLITPQSQVYCNGGYYFGGRTYHCWREHGHGTVDLHRALVESCDVYFYRLGQALGVDRLARYAQALGLGRPVGLGLGREAPGIVPSRAWKQKRFGEPWMPGETLSIAIGQGFNTATPAQMLGVIAAVANGGQLLRPRFIKAVEGEDGLLHQLPEPQVVGRVPVSAQNLEIVKAALTGVVMEPGGTGGGARLPYISMGGKTGTAQVVKLPQGMPRGMKLPEEWQDHAWFLAFAPAENPRIAISVFVEHGGHGGSAAAPVAKALVDTAAHLGYFGNIPGVYPPPPPPPPEAQPPGEVPAPAQPATPPPGVQQAEAGRSRPVVTKPVVMKAQGG